MRPFSPLYYVKENKARCVPLILMIFITFGVYLGGLYVSNPMDNWQLAFTYYDDMTTVSPASDDTEYREFQAFLEDIQETGKVELLKLGNGSWLKWESIMGFETGAYAFAFQSVEDFRTYCAYMGIECDFDNLKNGSLILSERFASNLGLEPGDVAGKDFQENIYDEYTLDALTKEDGYVQYYINEEPADSQYVMLLPKDIEGKELYDLVHLFQKEHKVSVNDDLRGELGRQFKSFYLIYMFVVVLLSVILAVTINAAFVGMYQRRNFEFAVYRAIGIKKRRLAGKLMGELLWMDFIGLAAGALVFFLGLYLFNNLVLYPVGKYLRYFEPLALFGILLCNLVVLVPLMVTRSRQMMKADICEY